MIERDIEIINKLGLHARAAAKLVNTAAKFASKTEIEFNTQTADAKSIMSVLILAATQGSKITIRSDGADEQEAMHAITSLIDNLFDEDE
ncbi:MAG: HPr family phosphocarrier protein [Pseudomonadota bacterium]